MAPDGAAFVPSSLFEFRKVSVIAVFVVQIIQVGSLTALKNGQEVSITKHRSKIKTREVRYRHCCGPGIRCHFDPWIRHPGWVKNQDPDPGHYWIRIRIHNTGLFVLFNSKERATAHVLYLHSRSTTITQYTSSPAFPPASISCCTQRDRLIIRKDFASTACPLFKGKV